ncbi:MAG TPA: efflux RND transporter periplasmic adaptor subunit, partial [Candidatus Angelobacter sp.]
MSTSLQARSYRKPFFVVLVINVVLLAGVGAAWWHFHRPTSSVSEQPAPADAASTANTTPEAQYDTQLAPIQLTPQRMQSIGVRFGKATYKNVNDEIRATGTVDADETRISYVQMRFPGWIRRVYADATYQYVHKGQPLFTIY